MKKTTIALVAALAIVAAACGGDSVGDNVAERLAENALENELGGDVDIDISGDGDDAQIDINTDEGSISIGGGEIPDELTVAVPSDGDVLSSITTTDGTVVYVAWPASEYDALVAFYEDWVGDQPTDFEKTSISYDEGGSTVRNTSWFSSEADITIVIADCPLNDGSDGACVNIIEAG